MAGQRLMCVWQAVYALDPSCDIPQKVHVRTVSATFSQNPAVNFYHKDFDKCFTLDDIDFDKYVDFVKTHMTFSLSTYKIVEDTIESISWDICKKFYSLPKYKLDEEDCRKLWEAFNRLCNPGTLPPEMDAEVTNWLAEQLCGRLNINWSCDKVPPDLCYGELMALYFDKIFSKVSLIDSHKAIEGIYDWLVKEIGKTGWLYKRTRKQANWTGWLKRWFVLSPGQLAYYVNPKLNDKKGEIVINKYSRLEELPHYKSFGRKYPFRFRITNSPYIELECSACSEAERNSWMTILADYINAAKSFTTPVKLLISQKKVTKPEKRESLDEKAKKYPPRIDHIRATEENIKSNINNRSSYIAQKLPNINTEHVEAQISRILEVFKKFDKNKNGSIDEKEFRNFIKGLGLTMTDSEIRKVFSDIETSRDGIITIDEFTKYFIDNVLGEMGNKFSQKESELQAAFIQADRDGTGTIDFHEFAEYVWDRKRSARLSRIRASFDSINEGQDEISFEQFKNFFQKQMNDLASSDEEESAEEKLTLEDHLRTMYDEAEVQTMTKFLRERWDAFVSFKRKGSSGNVVMEGKHGMVADVLPGKYNLVDLACFSDLPPITPYHAVIKDFQWVSGPTGGHGKLIFPSDFDGVLPIAVATSDHLQYYGCSLANSTQVQICLMYRHGIQDFTYLNQYLEDYVQSENGGAGVETHEFCHLDCPLESDSGYFIIGKIFGDELHLTAFDVPIRHTLYIPGGTIHSNDHLRGTWRTMLSDESDIDHVHLVRKTEQPDKFEHFTFTFV